MLEVFYNFHRKYRKINALTGAWTHT